MMNNREKYIKSIDNFNLDFDVKFSTYAVAMIIGEIRRYQRDNNSDSAPRKAHAQAGKC